MKLYLVSCLIGLLLVTANAQYITPTVSTPCTNLKELLEVKNVIAASILDTNMLLNKYIFYPDSVTLNATIENEFKAIVLKYHTADLVVDAPVDGYHIEGRDAFSCWSLAQMGMVHLRAMSHILGDIRCRLIHDVSASALSAASSPGRVYEITVDQVITASSAHPSYPIWFPPTPLDAKGALSSVLYARVIYQLKRETQGTRAWKISYKSEDFSRQTTSCVDDCDAVPALFGSACPSSGTCVTNFINLNSVMNPVYPFPPGYITVNGPGVVHVVNNSSPVCFYPPGV